VKSFIVDLRYGWRIAGKNPLSTLVAVVSIALGIGGTLAVFSFLDAALLHPLPQVKDLDRLAVLYTGSQTAAYPGVSSYPDFQDYRKENDVLSGLATYKNSAMNLRGTSYTERFDGTLVSSNYFEVAGLKPVVGRFFLPEEGDSGAASQVAVISQQLWQTHFGSNPAAIGEVLKINGQGFTLIGVAPLGFRGLTLERQTQIWVPLSSYSFFVPGGADRLANRGWHGLRMFGRLKPGVTMERAQLSFNLLGERLRQAYQDSNKDLYPTLVPASTAILSPGQFRLLTSMLALLSVVVAIVLLLACVNVVNLLLARTLARSGELRLRQVLGVSRQGLLQQLFAENLIYVVLGGLGALLVGTWGMGFLTSMINSAQFTVDIKMNPRVLLFAFGLTLFAGLFVGLLPAIRSARFIGMGARGATGSTGRSWGRKVLVVGQVAVSLLLLIAFGLIWKTLVNLQAINTGIQSQGVLTATIDLGPSNLGDSQVRDFLQRAVERIGRLPKVESVSSAGVVPLSGDDEAVTLYVEGYQAKPDEDLSVGNNLVGEAYFKTLGSPLVRGRDFTPQDRTGAPLVAIVNHTLANRFWPNQDPIGKRLSVNGAEGPFLEIVGVAEDGKYVDLREGPKAFLYQPHAQAYQEGWASQMTLLIKAQGDPLALTNQVRSEIKALLPDVPIFDVKPLSSRMAAAFGSERVLSMLLGAFALLATTLAVIGLYGVMSYSVSQRTQEMGVRMAIGAPRESLLRQILREGMTLVVIGLAIGSGLALATTQFLSNTLYGVKSRDPMTFLLALALLIAVALVANYAPARRAMSVDPVVALRS